MSQAVALFKVLVAIGPAVSELWPLILQLWETSKLLWEKVQTLLPTNEQDTGVLGILSDELNEEEVELEAAVVAAFSAGGRAAMFDLSKLRAMGKWAKAHPKAAELLIAALSKLVPLFGS